MQKYMPIDEILELSEEKEKTKKFVLSKKRSCFFQNSTKIQVLIFCTSQFILLGWLISTQLRFSLQFDLIQMANTQAQNSQRGTIFLTFLTVLFFCIFNIINCVKKRIDPVQSEGENSSKYKEGDAKEGEAKEGETKAAQVKRQKTEEAIKEKPEKQKQEEDSTVNFDGAAIAMKAQQVQQKDQPVIKVLKRNEQFQLIYFPFFLLFTLNILTGTCKAFSLVNYLFTLIIVLIFNVIKWHRKCSNHICLNLVFDNLWILMLFFELLNQWAATPIAQPYIINGT